MTLIVAFDNGAPGDKMAVAMGDYGRLWPTGKDWNDDLMASRKPSLTATTMTKAAAADKKWESPQPGD